MLGLGVTNEAEKVVDGLSFGDAMLDTFLLVIERYLARTGTDITVVGISHLTGTIDDTSHNSDLQTLHVLRSLLYAGYRGAQIVESATAARTGDILRLYHSESSGL